MTIEYVAENKFHPSSLFGGLGIKVPRLNNLSTHWLESLSGKRPGR
jgi:hypothetical protein